MIYWLSFAKLNLVWQKAWNIEHSLWIELNVSLMDYFIFISCKTFADQSLCLHLMCELLFKIEIWVLHKNRIPSTLDVNWKTLRNVFMFSIHFSDAFNNIPHFPFNEKSYLILLTHQSRHWFVLLSGNHVTPADVCSPCLNTVQIFRILTVGMCIWGVGMIGSPQGGLVSQLKWKTNVVYFIYSSNYRDAFCFFSDFVAFLGVPELLTYILITLKPAKNKESLFLFLFLELKKKQMWTKSDTGAFSIHPETKTFQGSYCHFANRCKVFIHNARYALLAQEKLFWTRFKISLVIIKFNLPYR